MARVAKVCKVVLGDVRPILNFRLSAKAGPKELASYTAAIRIEWENGDELLPETSDNLTKQPTQAFTADGSELVCTDHGADSDDRMILATSGTLPSGATAGIRYHPVEIIQDRLKLSLRENGNPITLADAGTGNHTFYLVGSLQFVAPVGLFTTTGLCRAWIKLTKDGTSEYWPKDEGGIPIKVVAMGATPDA